MHIYFQKRKQIIQIHKTMDIGIEKACKKKAICSADIAKMPHYYCATVMKCLQENWCLFFAYKINVSMYS
jgi:hypothetical protein